MSQTAPGSLGGGMEAKGVVLDPEIYQIVEDMSIQQDEIASADFNAVDFINKEFPTEQSLVHLDPVLTKLRIKIAQTDAEIARQVRQLSGTGDKASSDLETAQQSIKELFSKIHEIKEKVNSLWGPVHALLLTLEVLGGPFGEDGAGNLLWSQALGQRQAEHHHDHHWAQARSHAHHRGQPAERMDCSTSVPRGRTSPGGCQPTIQLLLSRGEVQKSISHHRPHPCGGGHQV